MSMQYLRPLLLGRSVYVAMGLRVNVKAKVIYLPGVS